MCTASTALVTQTNAHDLRRRGVRGQHGDDPFLYFSAHFINYYARGSPAAGCAPSIFIQPLFFFCLYFPLALPFRLIGQVGLIACILIREQCHSCRHNFFFFLYASDSKCN
jgi:hypothetical protein